MAGSESKRATVYNKPGVGVRKMEATRWLAALFFLIILFAGIYFYGKNSKSIATLGLPVTVVVGVGVIYCAHSDDSGHLIRREGGHCSDGSRPPVGATRRQASVISHSGRIPSIGFSSAGSLL